MSLKTGMHPVEIGLTLQIDANCIFRGKVKDLCGKLTGAFMRAPGKLSQNMCLGYIIAR